MDTQTPEDKAAELAAATLPKEEEVRASVIAEFGFDEATDAEKITKMVKKEMDSREKLSKAIGQKVKYRTDYEALKGAQVTPPKPTSDASAPDFSKVLDDRLRERDLDDLNLPDDIRKETDEWARFKGISVKQAAKAPHIAAKINDYEAERKTEEAAITRKNRTGGKQTVSIDNPPQVDLKTPEGRKTWDEWKEALRKQGM